MIRHVDSLDFYKGYMQLINIFTREPRESTLQDFKNILIKIKEQNSEIFVIEQDNKIVATIHTFYEYKIHNNFKLVCHIEDLATDKEYRNRGYATKLLEFAMNRALEKDCYKTVLCTNTLNKDFYLHNGFLEKGTELCIYH